MNTKLEKSKKECQEFSTLAVLQHSGVLQISGTINEAMAKDFVASLLSEAASGTKELTVVINSPGGEMDAGMAIYDAMAGYPGTVNTACIGRAFSMAAVIFLAGKERTVVGHSRVMVHRPSLHGTFGGDAGKIESVLKDILRREEEMVGIISKTTGKSKKAVRRAVEAETFFTAAEAVSFGIATRASDSITEVLDCKRGEVW